MWLKKLHETVFNDGCLLRSDTQGGGTALFCPFCVWQRVISMPSTAWKIEISAT